jgi:hypothetical protein
VLVAGRGDTEDGGGAKEDRGGFHGELGPPSYRPKPLAQMAIQCLNTEHEYGEAYSPLAAPSAFN